MRGWLKDIPGFEGRYAVDMGGNVYSYHSRKYLKANYAAKSGHVSMCLGHPNRRRWVHEIVLTTFVGERPEGLICRHLDGDPRNNSIFNLEWATQSQNQLDVKHHNPGPKRLSVELIQQIREHIRAGVPNTTIGEWYAISNQSVSAIKTGVSHRDV